MFTNKTVFFLILYIARLHARRLVTMQLKIFINLILALPSICGLVLAKSITINSEFKFTQLVRERNDEMDSSFP